MTSSHKGSEICGRIGSERRHFLFDTYDKRVVEGDWVKRIILCCGLTQFLICSGLPEALSLDVAFLPCDAASRIAAGERIEIREGSTYFGPLSHELRARVDTVEARVMLPTCNPRKAAWFGIRGPGGRRIRSVKMDGQVMVMKLGVGFLITFLFSAVPPLLIGQRSGELDETARKEVAAYSRQATTAAQAHDFAKAEEEWRKVLELDPHSAPALNNLGMVFYLEHKYPEAEATLRRALKSAPSLVSAQVLLGATLGKEGKIKEAAVELERTLKSPLSESAERTARMSLFQALFASKDYPRALEALEPLAKKYPNDVDILYSLGQTYLQLSLQTFEQIAIVSPESYRVHQILAESLAQQGKYHEAIREYRLALDQKPDLPGVHYQIGLLYRMYENTSSSDKKALQEFESELKNNPYDAWSEYRLGRIYIKQEKTDDAISHLRRAVQLDETIVPARVVLARMLEKRGDLEEAKRQLEAAGRIEPSNATVHYRLANLFKEVGDLKASEEEMKRFEAIQTTHEAAQRELEKAIQHSIEPEGEETPAPHD